MSATEPRLIDANALLNELKEALKQAEKEAYFSDEWQTGLSMAIDYVESAPTVETTDHVLDSVRISNWLKVALTVESAFWKKTFSAFKFDNDIQYPHRKPVKWETATEALKKLEALLPKE